MKHSFLSSIIAAPEDSIFQLQAAFQKDIREDKVDLSIGLYRNEELKTPILQCVKKVEENLLSLETSKSYLPIQGSETYIQQTAKLVFGDEGFSLHQHRICGIQVPGGTAGIRIAAEVMQPYLGKSAAIFTPTWPNHLSIFKKCGYTLQLLSYCHSQSGKIHFEQIMAQLESLEPNSLLILQACCYNPIGLDFSAAEKQMLAQLIQKKQFFPIVDFAYQGLGDGIDLDASLIRILLEAETEFIVVSSYSKNFGLYSERIGSLFVITQKKEHQLSILSQLKLAARTLYSNPPKHGSLIIETILADPVLRSLWHDELQSMRFRLNQMRNLLTCQLTPLIRFKDFSSITQGKGMFSVLPFSPKDIFKLQTQFGIYMTFDGRINLAGLNEKNVSYVADCFHKIWKGAIDT